MNGGANFTNKAQDAIMQAQQSASEKGQQQIDALHLLLALLSQEGSIVLTILQKLGIDAEALQKKVEAQLWVGGRLNAMFRKGGFAVPGAHRRASPPQAA